MALRNCVFLGDNLEMLRARFPDGSVDLVYLDPPFNSNHHYSSSHNGGGYRDVWRWTAESEDQFTDVTTRHPDLKPALTGFRSLLGDSGDTAYLVWIAPRLAELRRVLKTTGSIYLHCDQHAGAALKLLMDVIFGKSNFLNQIVWCYGLGGSSRRRLPRKHDDILWYSRVPNRHFFQPPLVPATSQRMKGQLKKAPDYWYIPTINNMARERSGYPTQKPEALLERIISSSSKPGDLVLDPCCGSGTTLAVAQRSGRDYVGMDTNPTAIKITRGRL